MVEKGQVFVTLTVALDEFGSKAVPTEESLHTRAVYSEFRGSWTSFYATVRSPLKVDAIQRLVDWACNRPGLIMAWEEDHPNLYRYRTRHLALWAQSECGPAPAFVPVEFGGVDSLHGWHQPGRDLDQIFDPIAQRRRRHEEVIRERLWLGDAFFEESTADRSMVEAADWLKVTRINDRVMRLDVWPVPFSSNMGEERDSQVRLRALLYPRSKLNAVLQGPPPAASGSPDSSIVRDAGLAGEEVAKALTASGFKADFSPASFEEIERFFCEHVTGGGSGQGEGRPRPGGLLAEDSGRRLFAIGGYLGEVLRRSLGGTWIGDDADPLNEVTIALRLASGRTVWPMQRPLIRLKYGPTGDIVAFGREVFEAARRGEVKPD